MKPVTGIEGGNDEAAESDSAAAASSYAERRKNAVGYADLAAFFFSRKRLRIIFILRTSDSGIVVFAAAGAAKQHPPLLFNWHVKDWNCSRGRRVRAYGICICVRTEFSGTCSVCVSYVITVSITLIYSSALWLFCHLLDSDGFDEFNLILSSQFEY